MIKTELIALTTIDWPKYLQLARLALGYSVSDTIDRNRLKLDLSSFLLTLREMQTDKVDAYNFLTNSLLRHASASFICTLPAETLNKFKEWTDLQITSVEANVVFRMAVMSGNLAQWKETVITGMSEGMSPDIKMLCNGFMLSLETSGLKLWTGYSKTVMNGVLRDGTSR